eukprot:scaffold806_cov229-Pinguiococcus_pyrenoidosus.AAC.2
MGDSREKIRPRSAGTSRMGVHDRRFQSAGLSEKLDSSIVPPYGPTIRRSKHFLGTSELRPSNIVHIICTLHRNDQSTEANYVGGSIF